MAIQALNRQAQNRYNYKPGGIYSCVFWESANRHDGSAGMDIEFSVDDTECSGTNATYPAGAVNVLTHPERSKMTVNATQEKGLMLYTITLELTFDYDGDLLGILNGYRGKALGAKVTVNNKGANSSDEADTAAASSYVVGLDPILGYNAGDDEWFTDFALFLDSIEADSGAKLADGTTATVKFTSVQGTPPVILT